MQTTVVLTGVREVFIKKVLTSNPTEQIIINVMKVDGTLLEAVPPNSQTSDVVLAAVTQNGMALNFCKIPQTTTIVNAAVSQNGKALKYLNRSNFTAPQILNIQVLACTNSFNALDYCLDITSAELLAAFPTV